MEYALIEIHVLPAPEIFLYIFELKFSLFFVMSSTSSFFDVAFSPNGRRPIKSSYMTTLIGARRHVLDMKSDSAPFEIMDNEPYRPDIRSATDYVEFVGFRWTV